MERSATREQSYASSDQLTMWQRPQARLREKEIAMLAPIMYDLAKMADANGSAGVTISHLRLAAVMQRVVLTGKEKKRELSYLGAVPKAAGLERVPGLFWRSEIPDSHGNLQAVWRIPRVKSE